MVEAIIAAVASFLGAWFAAQLALGRFYREKLWQRKVEAYSAMFDALHHMNRWFEEHLRAARASREIPDQTSNQLGSSYDKAQAELLRRLDSEIWLLPADCRTRLSERLNPVGRHFDSNLEMFDAGFQATGVAIADFAK
jgi:hypothetical protein